MIRHSLLAALALVFLISPLSAQQKSTDAILILDASGSMWGTVDGQTKISAARKAIAAIVSKWKPADKLGLMVYGHRSKTDCNDIELMIPVGTVDPAQITSAVNGLNPKGKTPLTESLRQASAALGAKDATVILVSDGIETCKGDPCAVAAELKKSNVRFTAHVIGFNVADPVTKTQLQCIARNTGGVYLDAGNASSLENALGKAVDAAQGAKVASEAPAKAPPPDPLKDKNWRGIARLAEGLDPIVDADLAWTLSKPGSGGEKGEFVQTEYGARLAAAAEPGAYIMTVDYGQTSRNFPVTVTKTNPATNDVVLNAGYVTSEGALAGSGEKADKVTWEVRTAGNEYVATNYDAVPRFILPAGDYVMVLSKGNAEARKPFSLTAGDSINLAMTLDASPLLVDAIYAAGGPKVEKNLAVSIRKPPAVEGEEGEWIATNYDPLAKFDLPAGPYDLIVEVGPAKRMQRIEIRSGAPARVTVNMNAGVLALEAPGAEFIEVFSAQKDINGERKSVYSGYDASSNLTFLAGDYVVQAKAKDRTKEAPVTIKAGERIELTVKP